MAKGRVIGIDVEIRPHNREAIEKHFLFPLITLVEGNSIDASVVNLVEFSSVLGKESLSFWIHAIRRRMFCRSSAPTLIW